MNIPIFCINLERAKERKQRIEDIWIKDLDFEITFMKAWDGEDIVSNNFYFQYNQDDIYKTIKRYLTPGEIACTTSHCMVYEYALKNNIDYCIVMEDDMLPTNFTKKNGKNGFNKAIEDIITYEKNIDIVFLFEIYNKKFKQQIPIKQTKNLFMYKRLPWGNQMILLNKNGLEKMYNNLKNITYLADHWNIFPFTSPEKDIGIIKTPLAKHEFTNSKNYNSYIQRS